MFESRVFVANLEISERREANLERPGVLRGWMSLVGIPRLTVRKVSCWGRSAFPTCLLPSSTKDVHELVCPVRAVQRRGYKESKV